MSDDMTPREQAIAEAGRILAAGCARQAALSPREAAEEAYRPGGPSVDELERRITARRQHYAELEQSPPTDTSPPTG
jgi:hypothetical protein